MSIVYAHLLNREDVYNAELGMSTHGSQSGVSVTHVSATHDTLSDTHVSNTHDTLAARDQNDNCCLD